MALFKICPINHLKDKKVWFNEAKIDVYNIGQ